MWSGMGTSFVIKNKVIKLLKENNIEATVESGSMEAMEERLGKADIVLCQQFLGDAVKGKIKPEQPLLMIQSLMDSNEYDPKILEAIEKKE